MDISYRKAATDDAGDCVSLRGKTRQNALTAGQLEAIGITRESWALGISQGEFCGYVALDEGAMVGYCFGDIATGEILVLAILPEYENLGIGRVLLDQVVCDLKHLNHKIVFLGCSSNPISRSYGFYRHLGWCSTGKFDSHQDEILELVLR